MEEGAVQTWREGFALRPVGAKGAGAFQYTNVINAPLTCINSYIMPHFPLCLALKIKTAPSWLASAVKYTFFWLRPNFYCLQIT